MTDEPPKQMKVVSQEELDAIDINTPLPILLKNSPLAQRDPERAKILDLKLENPIEVQKANAVEIRAALDQKIALETMDGKPPSDETVKLMMKYDAVLTNLHQNKYGTKNLNVTADMTLGHAQVASMMRKHAGQEIPPDVKIVDVEVVPKDEEEYS
jgi:hypothetical protein